MRSPFVHEWAFANAARSPEAPAVDSPAFRLTYRDLALRVRVLAAHLAAGGIGPGDRVLLALPNAPATVVAGLAIHALGAAAVEVNREWSADILGGIIAQAGVRQAFVLGRDARLWSEALARQPLERLWVMHPGALPAALRSALGDTWCGLLLEDGRVDPALPTPTAPTFPALDAAQPALILYTSGSTGRPRGVVQTHRNIDANSRAIVEYLGLTSTDRAMLVLPLYYCYGRSVLQTHLLAGASVFLDNRFVFPRTVLEAAAAEGCTGFAGVPLTFEIIRRQVDVASIGLSRLRYLTQAGGAMAQATIDWVREAFAPAQLYVMYGQTEATARLSYLPPDRARDKRGSIGIPIPGVELAVVDEQGSPVPDGETGNLVARGDNVTLGYLDLPEETAEILRAGWLWTGDLASRDTDGFFFHRGRSKEILKIGGHRVSPVEIEHVIAEHPDVTEAAVIGLPHALMGEVPAAFVVLRPGGTASEEEVRRFCRERMASYRVPTQVRFLDSLPRNESGKLLRAALLQRAGPTSDDSPGRGR